MLSGGIGRELAEWIISGAPKIDLFSYDPARFHASNVADATCVPRPPACRRRAPTCMSSLAPASTTRRSACPPCHRRHPTATADAPRPREQVGQGPHARVICEDVCDCLPIRRSARVRCRATTSHSLRCIHRIHAASSPSPRGLRRESRVLCWQGARRAPLGVVPGAGGAWLRLPGTPRLRATWLVWRCCRGPHRVAPAIRLLRRVR